MFRRSDLSGAARIGWVVLVPVLPVVGVLGYLITRLRLMEGEQRSVTSYDQAVRPGAESIAEQITDLARLRVEGKITDGQFEERRQELA